MHKRPDLTIVAATSAQLFRADFGADRDSAPDLRSGRRTETGTVADAVRTALALGPARPARRVFVLCEDLPALSLSLPSIQTEGLAQVELHRALAFEAEPFSNVPPTTAVTGSRSAPHQHGMDLHWIVECPLADMEAIRDVVRKAGGRLEGVTNPAGLPAPLGRADMSQGWYRLEHWTRGRVLVRSGKGNVGRVVVQSLAASQPEAVSALSGEWCEALCHEPQAAPDSVQSFALADAETARRWLHAWGRCLAEGPADGIALAVPPRTGTPVQPQVALGLGLFAAAAMLCFGHWRWATGQHRQLGRALADIRAEEQQISQADRRNSELRQAISTARQQQLERETACRVLDARRQALAELLRALSEAMPSDGVIQRLQDDGDGQVVVWGTGWSAGAADVLAGRLAGALGGTPWTVQPECRTAKGLLEDAGPWSFGLRVALDDAWTRQQLPAAAAEEDSWP